MVRFGWETVKKRPWFFIGAICLVGLLQLGLQAIAYIPLAGSIISTILGIYIGMGVIHFMLRAHDATEQASINDLWKPHPFWNYLGGAILKGLIASGPLLVSMLVWFITALPRMKPGVEFQLVPSDKIFLALAVLAVLWAIYVSIRLAFVEYIVIDKGSGPIVAIKESLRITRGKWVGLLVLGLALIGITILDALALLLGLLVAIPLAMLATVHAYRTLSAQARTAPAIPPAPTV